MSERFTVEEVESVETPPKARVEDARETFERAWTEFEASPEPSEATEPTEY